jgi:RNA polymerase sigma-70 factor (ECF subfamily)
LKPGGLPVDNRKFRELYDGYAKKLYNFVLWMTRNAPASEDILQAVFMKVWEHPSVPGDMGEAQAWLYAVARNQCLDYFRKRSRRTRFRLRYAHETPLFSSESVENRLASDVLAHLGEEERAIVYLHWRAGYSYKHIAYMLRSTENGVRVKAFRALAKLRKRYIREHQ